MRLYEPMPVTDRGLWAMLLHPKKAILEILTEQRQLEAIIRRLEPDTIHPMRDWNPLIVSMEDIWKRPIKTLKLFIKVRRCGIYKAVESELENRGWLYTSSQVEMRKSEESKNCDSVIATVPTAYFACKSRESPPASMDSPDQKLPASEPVPVQVAVTMPLPPPAGYSPLSMQQCPSCQAAIKLLPIAAPSLPIPYS